jgi:metal-responsive CopG/Arc/MetJ family transcriptional regulator
MKKLNLEQVSVQIDRDDLKTLRHFAVDADMSTSEIVREAVREYLERRTEEVKPPETLTSSGRQTRKEKPNATSRFS